MAGRVFCPLGNKWFDLYKSGKKTIELRKVDSPVAKQIIYPDGSLRHLPPFTIEFRRGYNGESLFANVIDCGTLSPDLLTIRDMADARVTFSDVEVFGRSKILLIRTDLKKRGRR